MTSPQNMPYTPKMKPKRWLRPADPNKALASAKAWLIDAKNQAHAANTSNADPRVMELREMELRAAEDLVKAAEVRVAARAKETEQAGGRKNSPRRKSKKVRKSRMGRFPHKRKSKKVRKSKKKIIAF